VLGRATLHENGLRRLGGREANEVESIRMRKNPENLRFRNAFL
jgi:hypothetical protein